MSGPPSTHPGSPKALGTEHGLVGPDQGQQDGALTPTPVAPLHQPQGPLTCPLAQPLRQVPMVPRLLSWLCPRDGWAGTSCWRIPGSFEEAASQAWEFRREGNQGCSDYDGRVCGSRGSPGAHSGPQVLPHPWVRCIKPPVLQLRWNPGLCSWGGLAACRHGLELD